MKIPRILGIARFEAVLVEMPEATLLVVITRPRAKPMIKVRFIRLSLIKVLSYGSLISARVLCGFVCDFVSKVS